MAIGKSQAEIRVQTLFMALGTKAEIPTGREPQGRQRHPHQGLRSTPSKIPPSSGSGC